MSYRALPLIFIIYTTLTIVCCLMWGAGTEGSVLDNIGKAYWINDDGVKKYYWEAHIIQVSFMMVLMCHIPFIFFGGKEALLITIDELMRKSISNALWHKMQASG